MPTPVRPSTFGLWGLAWRTRSQTRCSSPRTWKSCAWFCWLAAHFRRTACREKSLFSASRAASTSPPTGALRSCTRVSSCTLRAASHMGSLHSRTLPLSSPWPCTSSVRAVHGTRARVSLTAATPAPSLEQNLSRHGTPGPRGDHSAHPSRGQRFTEKADMSLKSSTVLLVAVSTTVIARPARPASSRRRLGSSWPGPRRSRAAA